MSDSQCSAGVLLERFERVTQGNHETTPSVASSEERWLIV